MCFSLGGGAKKHEVETQSASLGRDFAIHKVLPLLIITGGWGHQRGGGGELHDFNIALNAACAFHYWAAIDPKRCIIKRTFRTKVQLKVCSDEISWV